MYDQAATRQSCNQGGGRGGVKRTSSVSNVCLLLVIMCDVADQC